MPRVRHVGNNPVNSNSPTPVQANPQTVNAPTVNQVSNSQQPPESFSLVSPSERETDIAEQLDIDVGSLAGVDFNKLLERTSSHIPDWLTKAENYGDVVGALQGDYVGFAEPMSKNWMLMSQAGLGQGEPFAFIKGKYVRLNPLQYFILESKTYKIATTKDQNMQIKFVTDDLETPLSSYANQFAKEAENNYTCLLLVLVNGRLWPCRADFRGTKEAAGGMAIRAVEAAKTEEWLRQSDAHKLTAAIPIPSARVLNSVTTVPDVSKSSGRKFFRAVCNSRPSSLDEMKLYLAHLENKAFKDLLDEASRYYDQRLDSLDKMIGK